MPIDWDNPTERSALIKRVGLVEYNRLFSEHRECSTVATVNGYAIRAVWSRVFGYLFEVDDTGHAFSTKQQAEEYALHEANQRD